MLPKDILEFRVKFMLEELEEYGNAVEDGDMIKAFDSLIDLPYVAIGTAYLHGFPWNDGWERVQLANMQKIRATSHSDSLRGNSFDVIKPPGWVSPEEGLRALLKL